MRRSQGISDYKINAEDGVLDLGRESQGRHWLLAYCLSNSWIGIQTLQALGRQVLRLYGYLPALFQALCSRPAPQVSTDTGGLKEAQEMSQWVRPCGQQGQ